MCCSCGLVPLLYTLPRHLSGRLVLASLRSAIGLRRGVCNRSGVAVGPAFSGANKHVAITFFEDLTRGRVNIFAHESVSSEGIISMVHECMGDAYHIEHVHMQPAGVGYGVCR